MNNCELKKLKPVLEVLAALFLISLIFWFSVGAINKLMERKYIGREFEARNMITVSGKGEIFAKPDLALVNFSVVSEAKTVAQVLSENTKKMNVVIDSVKKLGVEEKDLKTTNFSIYPRYEWQKETICISPPCLERKRVLIGYEVRQTLETKIREMVKIGEIIQAATAAGANEVGNLQFTIDNKEELEKKARAEAIKEAKEKAKELASLLEVKLVRITSFSENRITPYYPAPYFMEAKALGPTEGEVPQIETGENKIEISVSITYEID